VIAPDMVEEAVRRALDLLSEQHAAWSARRTDVTQQIAEGETRLCGATLVRQQRPPRHSI
jgi:hypothetical protein